MKGTSGLALLNLCCYCLLCCKMLQVLRSLESWASNGFPGIPKIHLFSLYIRSSNKRTHCFTGVIELCCSKAESHGRNWAHGHLGNGEAKVTLHPWLSLEFCTDVSVLPEFSVGFSMPGSVRSEPAALCTKIGVHTAVPRASQLVKLLQKLL